MQAHLWLALAVGSGILLLLAAPTLSLRLGFSDEGNYREGTTTRRAYDLLAEGFGPGVNGPFVVTTVLGSPADLPAVDSLFSALAADPDVAAVAPPFPSNPRDPASSDAFLIRLTRTTAPQDAETNELVERLRREVIPTAVAGSSLAVSVTGTVALQIDFATYLATRIPIFFGAVLALSFVLLMVVFRSLLVPLKAVLMNGISLAAAYGVVVAIFQWGWLGSLFGIAGAPIEPQIPMMMFAIVFGLSMDYEVFLLSRVKEAYDQSGDAVESVADGLASTAQVITAAAAIMVVVFGSFAFEDNRVVKLFGVGLAAAVLLDATVVRLLSCLPRWSCSERGTGGSPGGLTPGYQYSPSRRRRRTAAKGPLRPAPRSVATRAAPAGGGDGGLAGTIPHGCADDRALALIEVSGTGDARGRGRGRGGAIAGQRPVPRSCCPPPRSRSHRRSRRGSLPSLCHRRRCRARSGPRSRTIGT